MGTSFKMLFSKDNDVIKNYGITSNNAPGDKIIFYD